MRAREAQMEEFFQPARLAGGIDFRTGEPRPENDYTVLPALLHDPTFTALTDKFLKGPNKPNDAAVESQANWNKNLNTEYSAGYEEVIAYHPFDGTASGGRYPDTVASLRADLAYGLLLEEYHTMQKGSIAGRRMQMLMQEAVRREFNVPEAPSYIDRAKLSNAIKWLGPDAMTGLQHFFRAQYNATQAYLREKGITQVQVFRGRSWKQSQVPDGVNWNGPARTEALALKPMTSVTTQLATAVEYANGEGAGVRPNAYRMVVADLVPASRVLSMVYAHGFGNPGLRELILIGGDYHSRAISWTAEGRGNLSVDDALKALASKGAQSGSTRTRRKALDTVA